MNVLDLAMPQSSPCPHHSATPNNLAPTSSPAAGRIAIPTLGDQACGLTNLPSHASARRSGAAAAHSRIRVSLNSLHPGCPAADGMSGANRLLCLGYINWQQQDTLHDVHTRIAKGDEKGGNKKAEISLD